MELDKESLQLSIKINISLLEKDYLRTQRLTKKLDIKAKKLYEESIN